MTTPNSPEKKRFDEYFHDKQVILESHMRTLVNLFEDGSNGLAKAGIQHSPVSYRIKTPESAIGSLRRRENERMRRQQLKERLQKQDRSWDAYWIGENKQFRTKDIGPFQNLEDIFNALHDIAGIRICVYFPEDVERVVKFIKDLGDKRGQDMFVDKPVIVEWEPRVDPDEDLEDHVRKLEHGTGNESDKALPSRPPPRPFGGYRATHARVQLKASKVNWSGNYGGITHKLPGNLCVEIQIATIVMHAWAQVEQDIIYKPKQPLFSKGQMNILDVFNGIVSVGESALKQLAILQVEERERLAVKQQSRAESRNVLSALIWQACEEYPSDIEDPRVGSCPTTQDWRYLDQLLSILLSSKHHFYGAICRLVHATIDSHGPGIVTCDIALHLLETLAKEMKPGRDQQDLIDSAKTHSWAVSIRAKALHVIEVMKMAIFLGVGEEYFSLARKALGLHWKDFGPPSLLEILELLHPGHPSSSPDSLFKIDNFCQKFSALDLGKLLSLQLPELLVSSGYTAQPVIHDGISVQSVGHRGTFVPRELCAFLADPDHTHWIPEIIDLAKAMANKRKNLEDRLGISQVCTLRSTASRRRSIGPLSEHIPVMTMAPIESAFQRLLLPETKRISFEEVKENGQRISLTLDRERSPLYWLLDRGNSPSLHVDKKTPRPSPYSGYFSPTNSGALGEERGSNTIRNCWRYNEKHENEKHEKKWQVQHHNSRPIDETEVEVVIRQRGNVFLNSARQLLSTYGSIDHTERHYKIAIEGVEFELTSTDNEYILCECTEAVVEAEAETEAETEAEIEEGVEAPADMGPDMGKDTGADTRVDTVANAGADAKEEGKASST